MDNYFFLTKSNFSIINIYCIKFLKYYLQQSIYLYYFKIVIIGLDFFLILNNNFFSKLIFELLLNLKIDPLLSKKIKLLL